VLAGQRWFAREITVSQAKRNYGSLVDQGFPEKIVLRKTGEIFLWIENLSVRSGDIRGRHGN
jgi:hypothetical protein